MSKKSKRRQKESAPSKMPMARTIGGVPLSPFARVSNIGAAAAENDNYLDACFIRTVDYETMVDVSNPKCILVGRTGIGKSALISRLQTDQENVINISPEEIPILHICHSDILKFCEGAGASLDMFYGALWRNVIVTEILKRKYHARPGRGLLDWFTRGGASKDENTKVAERYISELEGMFTDEEGFQVKEFTRKWETNLKGGFTNIPGIPITAEGSVRLTEEQRGEVVRHSEEVVSRSHMKHTAEVIQWMADDVFTDKQRRYYVTIDRLDEGWGMADTLRLSLIRALIESVKTFRRIQPLKIIIALRSDLLESVYAATSARGYQEEKHKDFHLNIRWDAGNIKELLDKRMRSATLDQKGGGGHSLASFMPKGKNKKSSIDYLVSKTLMRPRDAIIFLNECLKVSQSSGRLTWSGLHEAEKPYSEGRLNSLSDEWGDVYPCVRGYAKILKGRPTSFAVGDISREDVQKAFLEMCDMPSYKNDDMCKKFDATLAEKGTHMTICRELITILYKIGIIGIKKNPSDAVTYSYNTDHSLNTDEVQDYTTVWVHPAFWRCLGIQDRKSG